MDALWEMTTPYWERLISSNSVGPRVQVVPGCFIILHVFIKKNIGIGGADKEWNSLFAVPLWDPQLNGCASPSPPNDGALKGC